MEHDEEHERNQKGIAVSSTEDGEEAAMSDEEEAEMIAKALTQIHSSDNLTEEGKRGREMTKSAHPGILERRDDTNSTMEAPFTLEEMKRAILRAGLTSPGKDEIMFFRSLRVTLDDHCLLLWGLVEKGKKQQSYYGEKYKRQLVWLKKWSY